MFEGSDFIWFVQMFFVFLSEIPDFWVLQDCKVTCKFRDHHWTSLGHLWAFCGF